MTDQMDKDLATVFARNDRAERMILARIADAQAMRLENAEWRGWLATIKDMERGS